MNITYHWGIVVKGFSYTLHASVVECQSFLDIWYFKVCIYGLKKYFIKLYRGPVVGTILNPIFTTIKA